jgi:hypothetical protein
MLKTSAARKGLSAEEEMANIYDEPGMESLVHKGIEPRLLDWIKQNYTSRLQGE